MSAIYVYLCILLSMRTRRKDRVHFYFANRETHFITIDKRAFIDRKEVDFACDYQSN